MRQILIALQVLTILLVLCSAAVAGSDRYVTIGTGGVTGVYYPSGSAMAKMVNRERKKYKLRATVEATGGSVYNVNALMNGDLEFGIVQSDRQYQAFQGIAEWAGRPQVKLRSVFAIHPETVTIVAAADKRINALKDLRGKVVNIGNPGSGQRKNAIDVLGAAGLDYTKDLKAEGVKADPLAGMLQDGRIDAFIYTAGHPNGTIKEAVSGPRKVNFVAVPPEIVKTLTSKFAYYVPATIPVASYPAVMNRADVPSFGVKATLCTSADVPDDIVYAFTREMFENLEEFKSLHPAYSTLTRENMLQGLAAPLHPGALKYFREKGLK